MFIKDNLVQVGKHKGLTVDEFKSTQQSYLVWLSSQPWAKTDPSLQGIIELTQSEGALSWGKYKGKNIQEILAIDPSYIEFLRKSPFVQANCKSILDQIKKIDES